MRGAPTAAFLLLLAVAALPACPARAQAAAESALRIAADNVTGSHGPEGDFVMLNGNVRITRGRAVITADAGRYYKTSGMLYLDGRVKLVDSLTTVTCRQASYSEQEDLLHLDGDVTLYDKDAVLRAPAGIYDRATGLATLQGPVEGNDKRLRLTSDRVYYLRDSSQVQARGRVRGRDEENQTEIEASALDYDRVRKVAVATGDPVLRTTGDDGKVTELRALRLRVDLERKLAEASDSVRVRRDTLEARADHALFDDTAQRGWLTGRPRVWDDQTVVQGDSIEIWTEKRAVRRVVVRPNATMNYLGTHPDSRGEASRLVGERLDAFLSEGAIDSLIAVGKASSEYLGLPHADRTQERNDATGDTITVYFRDRKIHRAQVQGAARGTYRLAVDPRDTMAVKREVVDYDARRIEFQVPESRIVLDQEAHLTYQDLELSSRRVAYDLNRQTLVAEGNPVLADRGEKVVGNLMTYDLETRVGTIYQAETAYEKGLYRGDRIRKVGENQLDVMSGSYSTCDLRDPHYHFAAHYMKIYLKDKLVAKPVVFYVKNVPLLALPFWVFPIKPGRHSGFLFPQFELGFNNAAGGFVRNAGYYWAPNDYMDLTVSGDYYQAEPSWVMRSEGQYRLLYVLDGGFRGSFARNQNPLARRDDWDFSAEHAQELSPRTRLSAQAAFVSSRNYNSSNQFGRSWSQRLNRFMTSRAAITHNAEWASINAVVERRDDLDADQSLLELNANALLPVGTPASLPNRTQTLPSLSLSFPTRTLGSVPGVRGSRFEKALRTVYLSYASRFLAQQERRGYLAGHTPFAADSSHDSLTAIGQATTDRWGLANNLALSDSRRPFGWLNFQPRFGANVVVWDHDELGHRVVPASTWNASASMSTTFYGTFHPRWLGLEGLRHIITPSLSMAYSPAFPSLTYRDSLGLTRNRFNAFGGIGVSGFKEERINFGLDQRFQLKLKRKGKTTRLDNLLAWSLGGSYNFLYREQRQRHPLSSISSAVTLAPPGYANGTMSWVMDPYQRRPVRALSYNLGLQLNSGNFRRTTPDLPVGQGSLRPSREPGPSGYEREAWSLGLAWSYSGGYAAGPSWSSTKTLNIVGRYQFSPAWAVDYSASYDPTRRVLDAQRFSVSRDLHCWTATFVRTFLHSGEAEYYFRIGLKDQREIYFERGTRAGSIGGIQ